MSNSIHRSRTGWTAALGSAAVGVPLVVTHNPASASPGPATTYALQNWGRSSASASTAQAAPNITGAVGLSFTARDNPKRDACTDVGKPGFSPGACFVFEERLPDAAGKVNGRDSARCTVVFQTFRCDGTFFSTGKGSIEVSGSQDTVFAGTGGTDDDRNACGQADIVGGSDTTTRFTLHLLP